MQREKPYLKNDFSLTELSQLTFIPKHLLSRFFSESMKKSFTDYTNEYRIVEAKKMLSDPKYANFKISFVAYEVGFNSISTFNTAFKKKENISPSQFKKISDRDIN